MKIAVISDTHDHVWNLKKFVDQAKSLGIRHVIHCGDLVSAFMLEELAPLEATVHLVWGNNPGDRGLVTRACLASGGKFIHYGVTGEITIDGIKIAWIHDPHLAWSLAQTGGYRLVCYGHTHRWSEEHLKDTILLNPGEILGKKESPGWALIETKPFSIERMRLNRE